MLNTSSENNGSNARRNTDWPGNELNRTCLLQTFIGLEVFNTEEDSKIYIPNHQRLF